MGLRPNFSLDDKYHEHDGPSLMTGTQALVRLVLEQARRDKAADRHTAGFVTGYRGSPVGGVDMQMTRAKALLDAHDIVFRPAVNEDLGATMVWGTQQIHRDSSKLFDGVFGLFYAKAPGIDRSGDPIRHANIYGTDPWGGVLAIGGDDPVAKSSTIASQTDVSFADLEMPVFSPMHVQDIIDMGLHGWAMSRFAGVWTAMTVTPELMDGSGIYLPSTQEFLIPETAPGYSTHGGRFVPRLQDRVVVEQTLREIRLPAALSYIRHNQLNKQVLGPTQAKFGIITSGHGMGLIYDLFAELGIDEDILQGASLAVYKVGVTWPLEPQGLTEFATTKHSILVLDPKRRFLEPQIRDILYHHPQRPMIWGKTDAQGQPLLSEVVTLESKDCARALLKLLTIGADNELVKRLQQFLAPLDQKIEAKVFSERVPHFCSGCPHNTGTRVLPNARVGAGIGCHAMVQLQEGKSTEGYTHMGGEGMTIIGAAPFREPGYAWANVGDGTYFHSQTLAIRQAVASGETIGFKILFNDAVAMTGGQSVDGQQTVSSIVAQVRAEGVQHIFVTSDRPEIHNGLGIAVYHRDEILSVQEKMTTLAGVSVLIHEQVCATEKRRQIKRGKRLADTKKLFIYDAVCEGCGDCSIQSNCIAIEPLETELGRKRQINQTNCNTDMSCLKGFCPSFVEIEGGSIQPPKQLDLQSLTTFITPPKQPVWENQPFFNMVMTGVGGTGIMTISAICSTAAHLDGLNVASADISGLAQKGGAVTAAIKFSQDQAVHTGRIIPGSADAFIACDLVTATSADMLKTLNNQRTSMVANTSVIPTKEFIISKGNKGLKSSPDRLEFLKTKVQSLVSIDAESISRAGFGDSMYANMIMLGNSWQRGLLPLSYDALMEAISLNGVQVENNQKAFQLGAAVVNGFTLKEPITEHKNDLGDYKAKLKDYHNDAYASRFEAILTAFEGSVSTVSKQDKRLYSKALDVGFRLFAIKDEFEISRLYTSVDFQEKLDREFKHQGSFSLYLAPPFLPGIDKLTGRPKKRKFGSWILTPMKFLAKCKFLRFTPFNPFSWTQERQSENEWRERFVTILHDISDQIDERTIEHVDAILDAFATIKGFGPVKCENMARAEKELEAALNKFYQASQEKNAA